MNALAADQTTGIVYQTLANGALKALYASIAAATLAASPIYQTADVAAAAAGVPLVIDAPVSLTGNYTITAGTVMYKGVGKIATASFNLIHPNNIISQTDYDVIFDQSGGGQVYFTSPTVGNPIWWGAKFNGSTNSQDQITTRIAFQAMELGMDTNGLGAQVYGGVVSIPPGTYRHNMATACGHRNTHHVAKPGTVRMDWDKATIGVGQGSGSAIGIFTLGQPLATAQSASNCMLTACNPGNGPNSLVGTLHGQNAFIGYRDPATCYTGLVWYGIDFANGDFQSTTFLGSGKVMHCLQLTGLYRGYVSHCRFIGAPNDGLNVFRGTVDYTSCYFGCNGYYGGASVGDSSRNGLSCGGGVLDLVSPWLTTSGNQIVGCTFEANQTSAFVGGLDDNLKAIGNTFTGGNGIEGSYGEPQGGFNFITQRVSGKVVIQYDILYTAAGKVYQYTAGGTTSGADPTGTGTGITDGSATCQFAGTMPANGRVPGTVVISDITFDGTHLSQITVPWLGQVDVPANLVAGARCQTALTWEGDNESTIRLRNAKFRNVGLTSGTNSPIEIATNNGGFVDISGLEFEACQVPTGGGYAPLLISLGQLGGTFGTTPNTAARLSIDGFKVRNLTGTASNGLVTVFGNLNSYSIKGIEYDGTGTVPNVAYVEHAFTAASTLEYGYIGNCLSVGNSAAVIQLATKNALSVTGAISVNDVRAYNANSAGTTPAGGFITGTDGGGHANNMRLHVTNCEASWGGLTTFPIQVSNTFTGTLPKLFAHDNRFNVSSGAYLLSFNGNNSLGVSVTNNVALWGSVNSNDNGLPGEVRTRIHSTPTTGTWSQSDRAEEIGAAASGVSYYECTTQGQFSGVMSGATGTFAISVATVPYTATTPPSLGDYVNATGPTNGPFQVINVNTGALTMVLRPTPNNNSSGAVSLSYSNPVFKTVSLSA